MSEELKPCPFCGCGDIDLYYDTSSDYQDHWFWGIECCNCAIGYDASESENDSVKKWNTRVDNE